jgi:glycine/D-amino acid oxidase-like deaminating enzyme
LQPAGCILQPVAQHPSLHPTWTSRPYWWEEAPPTPATGELPERTEVAIIGAGYAGLLAAWELARAGIRSVVLDAGDPGCGAATRNHGMVGGGLKIPNDLDRRLGQERAAWIRHGAKESFLEFKRLLAEEKLEVDYSTGGRLTCAHSPAAFERQRARGEYLAQEFGYHTRVLPREEQRSEIGSDFYHGGLLIAETGGLHPGKLHRAFRRLAETAGVTILGQAAVSGVEGTHGHFTLRTAKGNLRAEKVIVATNAYTGAVAWGVSPFIRKRLVPVTAYIAATEELPPDLAAKLLPTNRMGADTKRSLFAFRLSPDLRRVIFAGRAKFRDIDERAATPILHDFMCRVWPELRPYAVTHAWKGLVCFTFDDLPHIGEQDGIYYAAGCQGTGVVMMSWLGRQVARKIITGAATQCGLDGLSFPGRPLYDGHPWFLPAVGAYYKARDALDRHFA